MAVAAFATIREMIRRDTLDDPGTRWTDDELDSYINTAQEVYARRTGFLTSEFDVYHNGIDFIYQTPADYIRANEFIVNNDNRTNLDIVDWKILAADFSPKFISSQTDEILYACFNYEGWNRFRFYPNTTQPAGTLLGTLKYSRLPVRDTLEIKNIETIADYALFLVYLKERNARYLRKAQEYKRKFERAFQKYKARSTGTLTNKAGFRPVECF